MRVFTGFLYFTSLRTTKIYNWLINNQKSLSQLRETQIFGQPPKEKLQFFQKKTKIHPVPQANSANAIAPLAFFAESPPSTSQDLEIVKQITDLYTFKALLLYSGKTHHLFSTLGLR